MAVVTAWWPRVWPASPAARAARAAPTVSLGPVPLGPPPPLAAAEVDRHAVRLVALDRAGDRVALHPFAALPALLRAGDLVVVNDAATLPASLTGHTARGDAFELRLTAPLAGDQLTGIAFGAGDWRTRTEDRPPPPALAPGDEVALGPLRARVEAVSGRRVVLRCAGEPDALWQAIYASAAPVQYAHRRAALPLYAVQTAYAARPWAVEMPSAGRALTWSILLDLRRRGIAVAALTHAAGLGATGDAALDAALPFPERYEVPAATATALATTRARGGRVIAIGTSTVRALEASRGTAGAGIAALRLDATTRPQLVDGLVSGLHVPGESHFDLLRAFAPAAQLDRVLQLAQRSGLSAHELGDACLVI